MDQEFLDLNRDTETFKVLTEHKSIGMIKQFLADASEDLSIDIETTATDPFCGEVVLTTITVPGVAITFDNLTIPVTEMVQGLNLKYKPVIAHNAMFEESWFLKHKQEFRNVHCTMIAEQKLYQGVEDIRHNIIATLTRRNLPIPEDMNKDVRADFRPGYNKHELKHVLYNQADTLPLHALKAIQENLIRSLDLNFHIKHIHFPLIKVLAKASMEGLVLDERKFTMLAKEAQMKMRKLEEELNQWLKVNFKTLDLVALNKPLAKQLVSLQNRKTRDESRIIKTEALIQRYESTGKTHLKAYEVAKNSFQRACDDLVTAEVELKDAQQFTSISWSSSAQVIDLLLALGCHPMPQAKDMKTHKYKPSLGKAARERWLLKNKNHELYYVLKNFDQYMKLIKHVNSFGESFLSKYRHPVTGKYHTNYKQGTVATGRLASGDSAGSPPKFNSQQIIAIKEVRTCFGTDPGYQIATVDLSGAELVTMCSLAGDMNLLRLSEGDMHSHFANKGWQAIYKSRKQPWTEENIISKDKNAELRKEYKPMLFGTVYGLKAPKAGETLNISEKEGQIAIDTIVSEIPDTINMVKEAVKFSLRNGYVIHNERTKSRRWFYPVLKAREEDRDLTFLERKEVEGGARNTRIQGTQADMLCEAMVVLQRFIDFYKLDAVLLMQVHDELVVKFHESLSSWFPQRVADIMTRAANRYLAPDIKMHADMKFGPTWIK